MWTIATMASVTVKTPGANTVGPGGDDFVVGPQLPPVLGQECEQSARPEQVTRDRLTSNSPS
jgi:hypothetical protein